MIAVKAINMRKWFMPCRASCPMLPSSRLTGNSERFNKRIRIFLSGNTVIGRATYGESRAGFFFKLGLAQYG
jgi:hypothetical protein